MYTDSILYLYRTALRQVNECRTVTPPKNSRLTTGASSTISRSSIRHSLGSSSRYADEISSVASCDCDRDVEDEIRIGERTGQRQSLSSAESAIKWYRDWDWREESYRLGLESCGLVEEGNCHCVIDVTQREVAGGCEMSLALGQIPPHPRAATSVDYSSARSRQSLADVDELDDEVDLPEEGGVGQSWLDFNAAASI
jgi:hypothetical protein